MNFIPLITFVLIANFTPGPNNLISTSLGMNFGYRKTVPFLSGGFCGFFIVMVICAVLSALMEEILPGISRYVSYIGALYILWLAWHTFRSSYALSESDQPSLGFVNGFFLQLLNPKAIVYGLTIYSGFIGNMDLSAGASVISAAALAAVAFSSTSSWTLFGMGISRFMKNRILRVMINTSLSLLLVYTAVQISGVLGH